MRIDPSRLPSMTPARESSNECTRDQNMRKEFKKHRKCLFSSICSEQVPGMFQANACYVKTNTCQLFMSLYDRTRTFSPRFYNLLLDTIMSYGTKMAKNSKSFICQMSNDLET